ncbi:MAG: NADH-quinone oxidoreductase subunit A [Gammaproteobacteria bacterium]|nr:NADH-quinone oxidoreductase subunit A [Gammaproteobacteria bacterium]
MSPLESFLLFLVAILGFVGITLLANAALGPKPVATALKLEPFECGATPADPINVRALSVKYWGVAVVFILFDIETVFLFIWALAAKPMTGFMLATYAVFTVFLVLALVAVLRARVLEEVSR